MSETVGCSPVFGETGGGTNFGTGETETFDGASAPSSVHAMMPNRAVLHRRALAIWRCVIAGASCLDVRFVTGRFCIRRD